MQAKLLRISRSIDFDAAADAEIDYDRVHGAELGSEAHLQTLQLQVRNACPTTICFALQNKLSASSYASYRRDGSISISLLKAR